MTKIGDEINELLEELTNELMIDDRIPGDVTSHELSKTTGLCRKRCDDILRERVESGLLTRHRIKSDSGKPIYAYHKK
jgi:predicted transcriptional regulator